MTKALTQRVKNILGSKEKMKGDRKYDQKTIEKALKKYDLKPEEKVTITNPVNNNSKEVIISRMGTPVDKMIEVFKDPEATQTQKNAILSAVLWEQGKENASFLAELFVSKGTHTRETQAFKKQMRFDYEMFADVFVRFLQDCSFDMKKSDSPTDAIERLQKRFEATSEMLVRRIQNLTEERMREKGFGIYVNRDGEVFDTRNTEITEQVKADVEAEQKENKENK